MTRNRARTGLLIVVALSTVLSATAVGLAWHQTVSHPDVPVYGYFLEGAVNGPAIIFLAALLVWRRPEHPVAWAFAAMSFFGGVQQGAGGFAHEALLAHAGDLPAGTGALLASSAAQSMFVSTWIVLVILFPTGDTISRRWRVVLYAGLCAVPMAGMLHLFSDAPFGDDPLFAAVRGPAAALLPSAVVSALSTLASVLVAGALIGGLVQLFIRYRRGTEEVRRQVAWFFYSVVVAVLVLLVPWPGVSMLPGWLLWSLAPLGVWTAVTVAILKYRLFDIDVLINRTILYGGLTAILGLTYLGMVVLLQQILTPFTSESDLAVAGSTLAVAWLFRPARAALQGFIDRRFYRSRYDAAATVSNFSSHLRDQVDLRSLSSQLFDVVEATMQPAHASLWLRDPDRGTT